MAAFAPPGQNRQPMRYPFVAGSHHESIKGPTAPPEGNPRARAPFLINTPYGAKYRSVEQSHAPYEYLQSAFPPNHMEMSKAPSQRNSAFHHGNQNYGSQHKV